MNNRIIKKRFLFWTWYNFEEYDWIGDPFCGHGEWKFVRKATPLEVALSEN
jgi:hypothetical protein